MLYLKAPLVSIMRYLIITLKEELSVCENTEFSTLKP